ncbi:MAG: cell division protein FtsZ [Piscinibacter sp.]|uniref:cell division protein FtsZ n=1 Tax=Piscinibacter sp. TaxID=1903157 RepID=UPI002589F9F7|nr:cell division protein FtsZ [Piscinibacter sp.]MCW5664485.1 cell division protein FtsZ [Piscinibacter sp.]
MSLSLALALFGAAVLAALAGHSYWQTRRREARRVVVAPPAEPREPVLREPGFDTPAEPAPDESDQPVAEPPRTPRRNVPRIDALIDAVATLSVEVQISGDMALMHLPPTRRAGSKPFFIEGLNVQTREWEPPAAGQRYVEFQAGVQLANRGGALNEIEYSEFVQKVQAFAEGIGALPDFPDMLEVVARARELDTFASEHDAQLAVHLRSRSVAWSVGYIQQHAARHGFVPGMVPGRLVLPGAEEGAPPVLTLAFDSQAALSDDPNQAALRDVTLAFDVPQTDPLAEPFITWQASAQALSLGMDAAIVDDNGAPLSAESFGSIGAELKRLYDELAARDLAAGSAAARRLFS